MCQAFWEPQAIELEQLKQILLPVGVALILVSFLLHVTRKRSKANSSTNVAARTHLARLHNAEPRRGDLEVMVEAFKAGDIDFRSENSSKRWSPGSPAPKRKFISTRSPPT